MRALPAIKIGASVQVLQWYCNSLYRRQPEFLRRIKSMKLNVLLQQKIRSDKIALSGFDLHCCPSIEHIDNKTPGQKTMQAQVGVHVLQELPRIAIDTLKWCSATQDDVAIRTAPPTTQKKQTFVSTYARPAKVYDFTWIFYLRKEYRRTT